MSLSGNLGFVPIDEVLRLLTRSNQQGSVEVTGNGLRGRVFVGKGGIDLVTIYDDEDLHRYLVNSGYADEKVLNRITTAETTLAAIADSNQPIVDLVRELSVESLYQIAVLGKDFDVHEGATTPYASPKSFDLETLLKNAEERVKDWREVGEVIPDLTRPIRFRRDLGEREEVTVRVDDWMVLSEIGTGASVTEIADRLGTTEFWTARVAARMVEHDLLVFGSDGDLAVDDSAEQVGIGEYHGSEEEPYESREAAEEPALASGGADDEGVDHSESWWQEPKDSDQRVSDDSDSRPPEVVSEGLSKMPSVDNSNDAEDEDEDSSVEGDTEAFLEKVFSELETDQPESEEGHGLLRRRRMGTLRDFSSDS